MKLLQPRPIPSWVVFQLLERCNLRCNMCYEWGEAGAYHERKTLAELDLDVLLRTIRDCLPGRPYFELFGGEPLLYSGIWDVIRLIREGGCELAFPTNGTLVEEHAERLVETPPSQLWLSLDGPERINDRQRGNGVFKRAMRGLDRLNAVKRARGSRLPELGVTYVVTPVSYPYIAEFFLEGMDLSQLSFVSIELQSYATKEQYSHYARVVEERFGVTATPCAKAYVREPAAFAGMDCESITRQMSRVRDACTERGIRFYSQPRTLEVDNITNYLTANWDKMVDKHSRCGFPWAYAEVSARGDVTTCHSFYDVTIGNIHEQSLLDIWRGERLRAVQSYLREQLFSICTACCRYYTAPSRAR